MADSDGQVSVETSDNMFYQFIMHDLTIRSMGRKQWHFDEIRFDKIDKFRPSIHPHLFLDEGDVHVPFYEVGSTRQCRTMALHAFLSCGSTPARPQLLISVFTHSDCLLMPSSARNRKVCNRLIQDAACCTWPCYLSRWSWNDDATSSMPSFCCNEAGGVSSLALVPQI